MTGMAAGRYGKLYITGAFMSPSITFGASVLPFTNSGSGFPDAFIAELDTAGNANWAKATTNEALPYCVYFDTANYIYFGGTLLGNPVSFGPTTLSAHYGTFLAKYDTSGNTVWAKAFASPAVTAFNNIYAITTDTCDNVWVSGGMANGLQLDSSHILGLPPGGSDAMFIVELNPKGDVIDDSAYISGGDDNTAMATDSHGTIYLCGDYLAPHFVLGADTLISTLGGEQFFIAQYKPYTTCRNYNSPSLEAANVIPEGLNIFPNPAFDEINVSYPVTDGEGANLLVLDISGRLIHIYPLNGCLTEISIRGLLPGIYLCRVDVKGKEIITKKLVVMK
jgi:type IX secretion system substrate protein